MAITSTLSEWRLTAITTMATTSVSTISAASEHVLSRAALPAASKHVLSPATLPTTVSTDATAATKEEKQIVALDCPRCRRCPTLWLYWRLRTHRQRGKEHLHYNYPIGQYSRAVYPALHCGTDRENW